MKIFGTALKEYNVYGVKTMMIQKGWKLWEKGEEKNDH